MQPGFFDKLLVQPRLLFGDHLYGNSHALQSTLVRDLFKQPRLHRLPGDELYGNGHAV